MDAILYLLFCATASSVSIVFAPASSFKRAVINQQIPQWIDANYFEAEAFQAFGTILVVAGFCISTFCFSIVTLISVVITTDMLTAAMAILMIIRVQEVRHIVLYMQEKTTNKSTKSRGNRLLQQFVEQIKRYRNLVPYTIYTIHFVFPVLFFWIRAIQGVWPFI